MEYTGIGKGKEEFVPRKHYEEFYRDGETIKELYEFTDGLMGEESNIPYGEYTLQVFNHAYHICWMIINEKTPVRNICASIEFENDVVQKYSWAVAYAILRLHEKFSLVEDNVYKDLARILPKGFYAEYYSSFVHEKNVTCPLEFSILFRFSPYESVSTKSIDFAKAKIQILDTMNKAIKLQKEYDELRDELHATYIEATDYKNDIKELQEQNALLQQKINKLENDSFYKAVNINTIVEYVQNADDLDKTDVATIKLMLLTLCANKVPNDVIEKIKNLKRGGNVTIGPVGQLNPAATQIHNHYYDKE